MELEGRESGGCNYFRFFSLSTSRAQRPKLQRCTEPRDAAGILIGNEQQGIRRGLIEQMRIWG
jgi:hypothetical protein